MAPEPSFDAFDQIGTVVAAIVIFLACWIWIRWETATKQEQVKLGWMQAQEQVSQHYHAQIAAGAKASAAASKLQALEAIDPPEPDKVETITSAAEGTRHKGDSFSFDYVPVDHKTPTVIVDASVGYQTFLGFGGSVTETSANLLSQAGEATKERVMKAYYSSSGLNYTLARTHMNSCDFSAGNWSCCEEASADLDGFTVERYEQSNIFPLLRKARELRGELKLVVSPWSPPSWMKDVNRMAFGGMLKQEWRQTWAEFYVRFAKETEKAGVPLWAFTVQNEPMAQTTWENCVLTAAAERDFVRDFLGPTMKKGAPDVKILIWDHNRDEALHRAQTIYGDPEAAKYVWGMGYHWYGDPAFETWPSPQGQTCFDSLRAVHDLEPEKHIILTECCQENGPHLHEWSIGERYAMNIIMDLNNWSEAWIDWNLILDSDGGPNHAGNACSAPILCDKSKSFSLLFQPAFFAIGHFSRWIQPGAQRILCSANRDALLCTAFANPDGTIAAVVLNRSDAELEYALKFNGRAGMNKSPPHSIVTLVFLNELAPEEDNEYVWTGSGCDLCQDGASDYNFPHEGAPFREAQEKLFMEKAGLDIARLLEMDAIKPSGKVKVKEKKSSVPDNLQDRLERHAAAKAKAKETNDKQKALGSPKARAKAAAKAKPQAASASTTATAVSRAEAPSEPSSQAATAKKWWAPLLMALVSFLLGRLTGPRRSLAA